MSILLCYGTRPEFIKIKPIIQECRKRGIYFKTLYVGQHQNTGHDEAPSYAVEVPNADNRLDAIVSSIGVFTDQIFDGLTNVLVQGDTASAFTCALAAFHRNKTLLHLEAGLRTYDLKRPFPEEAYRQMISRIATIHLCPTAKAAAHLRAEKISALTFVIGNTALDNLRHLSIRYEDEVLITMHRRENLNNIKAWFQAFESLAVNNRHIKFVLPLHHNPGVTQHAGILQNVKVIEALPHDQCLDLLARCKLVITDSGGIQEEASYLKKAAIVCRHSTERTEGLGTHSFICDHPRDLANVFAEKLNLRISTPSPYGDGYASQKLLDLLYNEK
jgi:UDP-N-acetylglucosamine 2-epimerase (non-hydrolysing)